MTCDAFVGRKRYIQWLRIHLECGGRFENNEVINLFIEFVESDFEEIELRSDKKQVVNFSTSVLRNTLAGAHNSQQK